jgi:hypothetical protein
MMCAIETIAFIAYCFIYMYDIKNEIHLKKFLMYDHKTEVWFIHYSCGYNSTH